MPRTISEKARRIAPSATLAMDAKAKALKAQGVSVVSFAAGEPDFDTPLPIRDAMKEAMDQNMTRYTPVSGTAELKDAIIHRFEEDHGLHYDPQEIIVSNGAKHSLYSHPLLGQLPGDGAYGRRNAHFRRNEKGARLRAYQRRNSGRHHAPHQGLPADLPQQSHRLRLEPEADGKRHAAGD